MAHCPEFLDKIGSGSFGVLNLASNLNWLWSEFGFLFFIKVVLHCLGFPGIQESGHLDLSTQSYGQLNKYYSFGHFPGPEFWLPGFRQFLGQHKLVSGQSLFIKKVALGA